MVATARLGQRQGGQCKQLARQQLGHQAVAQAGQDKRERREFVFGQADEGRSIVAHPAQHHIDGARGRWRRAAEGRAERQRHAGLRRDGCLRCQQGLCAGAVRVLLERCAKPDGHLRLVLRRLAHAQWRALKDGALKERLICVLGEQREHRMGARRLAKQGDACRVAAKGVDVALHPLQGGQLVERAAIGLAAVHRQKTKGTEPVADGHHHHITLCGQPLRAIAGQLAAAMQVAAAVNPDHHRAPALQGRCGDGQHLAVFRWFQRHLGAADEKRQRVGRLRAHGAGPAGVAHAVPGRAGLRRLKACSACIRDAAENANPALRNACQMTCGRGGDACWFVHQGAPRACTHLAFLSASAR